MRDSRADLKESDTSKMVIGSPQVGGFERSYLQRKDIGQEGLEVYRQCPQAQIDGHLGLGRGSHGSADTISELDEKTDRPRARRYTCCGLRPAAFFAIFIVSLLLIIGGVVGAVLGSRAMSPRAVSAPAPTATIVSSSPPPGASASGAPRVKSNA